MTGRGNRFLVFAVSAIALAFELAVVRLASFLLYPHYAYFALAVAVLGGGVGAAIVARWPDWMVGKEILVGLAFPVATLGLASPWPDAIRPVAFIVFAGLPYVAVGAWLSSVFRRRPSDANALYACDLCGAAAGVVAGYLLMRYAGPLGLAGLASAVALCVWLSVTPVRFGKVLASLTAGLAVAGALSQSLWLPALMAGMVPMAGKPLAVFEKKLGGPVWSGWGSFGRVDVVKTSDQHRLAIYADGMAGTDAIHYDGDLTRVNYLLGEPGSLPFTLDPGGKALIIGPGGGKDILMALLSGSTDVTAVEVNPLIVVAVEQLKPFTGDPYRDPRVKTVISDGRSFVRSTPERYDLIYLSLVMTGASDRSGWGLVENFIYTSQAVADYLARLRPGGRVAFVLHDGGDLIRAISMSVGALTAKGLTPSEAAGHLAVFLQGHPGTESAGRPVLLVTRDPIPRDEAQRLYAVATGSGATVLFVPGVVIDGPIADIAGGKLSLSGFVKEMAGYNIDARPVTDDRPFFYAPAEKAAQRVTVTLATVVTVGVLILLGGLRPGGRTATPAWPGLFVAAASGLGYMAVEVTFAQMLRGFVPEPTLAVGVILFSLLVASGLGSLWSGRLDSSRARKAAVAAALVTVGALLAYPSLAALVGLRLARSPLAERLAVVALVAGLPGLAMGVPFPYSLRSGDAAAELWLANGVFSVVGSVVALLVGMTLGLSFSLGLAALAYVVIALVLARPAVSAGERASFQRSD